MTVTANQSAMAIVSLLLEGKFFTNDWSPDSLVYMMSANNTTLCRADNRSACFSSGHSTNLNYYHWEATCSFSMRLHTPVLIRYYSSILRRSKWQYNIIIMYYHVILSVLVCEVCTDFRLLHRVHSIASCWSTAVLYTDASGWAF